jgi:hypothetical protein
MGPYRWDSGGREMGEDEDGEELDIERGYYEHEHEQLTNSPHIYIRFCGWASSWRTIAQGPVFACLGLQSANALPGLFCCATRYALKKESKSHPRLNFRKRTLSSTLNVYVPVLPYSIKFHLIISSSEKLSLPRHQLLCRTPDLVFQFAPPRTRKREKTK